MQIIISAHFLKRIPDVHFEPINPLMFQLGDAWNKILDLVDPFLPKIRTIKRKPNATNAPTRKYVIETHQKPLVKQVVATMLDDPDVQARLAAVRKLYAA